MEKNYGKIRQIAEQLPIGLYAKRRIETDLSEGETCSYYAPMDDKIVISFPQIAQGLAKIDENDPYMETAIRSMLYHEVSHALLTPKDLQPTDIVNIFEDERIETLLSDYYYNTDFKKNVFYINDYDGSAPQNALDEFYQVVRYRKGDPKYVDRVQEIINQYEGLTATEYDWWGSNGIREYASDIYDLYNQIAESRGEPKRNEYDDRRNGKDNGGILNKNANGNGNGNNQSNNGNSNGDGQDNNNQDDAQGNGQNSDRESNKSLQVAIANANEKAKGCGKATGEKAIEKAIKKVYDAKLVDDLSMILNNFNKKNSRGSSINSYSGVFNPRLVARDDYRYFQHKTSVNGNNTFGTFHLNLFLDDSGSMQNNEEVINKLIYALLTIERTNPNFTFDVITCADRIEIADKTKGFSARGGTYLSNKIIPLYRKVQKPNTYNYNLILFDGYADTDAYAGGNTFKVFDNNNCTIISDDSNSSNFKKIQSAKIIISNRYTDELINNVYKTLQTAFR